MAPQPWQPQRACPAAAAPQPWQPHPAGPVPAAPQTWQPAPPPPHPWQHQAAGSAPGVHQPAPPPMYAAWGPQVVRNPGQPMMTAPDAAPDGDDRRGPVRSAAGDPLQVLLPDGAALLQNVWTIRHRRPSPLALPFETPSGMEILDLPHGAARSGGGGGGAASLVLPGAAAYASLPVKAAERTERPRGAAGSLGRRCLKATVVIGWLQECARKWHSVMKVRPCGWSDGGGVLLGGNSAQ